METQTHLMADLDEAAIRLELITDTLTALEHAFGDGEHQLGRGAFFMPVRELENVSQEIRSIIEQLATAKGDRQDAVSQ